jgi:hypothetical protein
VVQPASNAVSHPASRNLAARWLDREDAALAIPMSQRLNRRPLDITGFRNQHVIMLGERGRLHRLRCGVFNPETTARRPVAVRSSGFRACPSRSKSGSAAYADRGNSRSGVTGKCAGPAVGRIVRRARVLPDAKGDRNS